MRGFVAAIGLGAIGVPQIAVATSAQGDVSVTIYNNNLALIQDIRPLDLPTGRTTQEFPDVSAQIKPETVTLSVSQAGIVEQNFDYDLLSPARLMDKAVGQTVTLVHTNRQSGAETSEPATVLANNDGTLLRVGNRIEVGGGPDTRIVFPSLPAGLKASPTLSVTLNSSRSGSRPATLSYLSNGFEWKADYVALFDAGAGKIDVEGWITLHNTSGTSFGNARVMLVAGQIGGDGGDYNGSRNRWQSSPSGNRAGTESAARERLGDFYIYPIAGRTTLANQQQKQVSFLDVKGAPAAKAYFYRNDWLATADEAVSVDTVLRFSTSAKGGLGDALPAGTVRVYMRDARGQPQFIGENQVGHTPMGSDLALKTGEAFDVKIQPRIDKRERIDTDEWERAAKWRISVNGGPPTTYTVDNTITYYRTSVSYRITNARPEPVTVEVVQDGLDSGWHDTRVPAESVKGEQRSLDERVWLVKVPASGETTLTAQFDTRY
jgi:hypothetical protein